MREDSVENQWEAVPGIGRASAKNWGGNTFGMFEKLKTKQVSPVAGL